MPKFILAAMGAIHFRRIEFVTSLSEHVGYKAGLALTWERIAELLDKDQDRLVFGDDNAMLRVRSPFPFRSSG